MTTLLDTDLSALFGIEIDAPAAIDVSVARILCGKCHGRGNFIGYTGRIVGKCFACDGTGIGKPADATPGHTIDVSAIVRAFDSAKSHGIQRPKLRLADFMFSLVPLTGRNAGAIYVKRGPNYMGKIIDGSFYPVSSCDDATRAKIIDVASKPDVAAKAYGLRTGSCACCGRLLTNGESIDLGIGPICRDKFGW